MELKRDHELRNLNKKDLLKYANGASIALRQERGHNALLGAPYASLYDKLGEALDEKANLKEIIEEQRIMMTRMEKEMDSLALDVDSHAGTVRQLQEALRQAETIINQMKVVGTEVGMIEAIREFYEDTMEGAGLEVVQGIHGDFKVTVERHRPRWAFGDYESDR